MMINEAEHKAEHTSQADRQAQRARAGVEAHPIHKAGGVTWVDPESAEHIGMVKSVDPVVPVVPRPARMSQADRQAQKLEKQKNSPLITTPSPHAPAPELPLSRVARAFDELGHAIADGLAFECATPEGRKLFYAGDGVARAMLLREQALAVAARFGEFIRA